MLRSHICGVSNMDEDALIMEISERIEKRKGRRRRPISLVPFSDVKLETSGRYIVKGFVPDDGLTVVWGPPKCGKSFLVTDIALHVALGWKWRERRVKTGSVVYVAAEGEGGLPARLEAFRQIHLANFTGSVPFYLVPTAIDLVAQYEKLIDAVKDTLDDTSPTLVVLDTLNRTLRGSENSDEDMAAYIEAADAIRKRFSCALIIVHHCGIDGTRPRGHTSLSGAVDAQIAVKKDSGGTITATTELMKDGAEGETFGGVLRVVEVGQDEDGDPISSCLLEPAEASKPQTAKLSPKQRRGLEVLHDVLITAGKPSPGGPHYPASATVVEVRIWREYLFKAGVLDKTRSNPRQDFKRLKDGLAGRGAIREWDGFIWTTKSNE